MAFQLASTDHQAAEALARALIPEGRRVPGDHARTVDAALTWIEALAPGGTKQLGRLIGTLDKAAVLWTGRPFRQLSAERQERLLHRWERHAVMRWPLQAFAFLLKSVHFDRPEYYEALGCVYDRSGQPEKARWLQQVLDEDAAGALGELECDVVVIGTGAGGAVVGAELAAKGYAVVFLEEGAHRQRDEFTGNSHEAFRKMYRPHIAVGNCVVPILTGRTVGGSTAINGGTCVRPPDYVMDRWAEQTGDEGLSTEGLRSRFERVEASLGVGPTRPEYIGGLGHAIADGCDTLGWKHSLILRNAPECDGQGVCTFGCPTDAKRSTNVSFVPAALQRGALLCSEMRATSLLREGGRVVGVRARGVATGAALTVRARAVVLAAGAMRSPLWLLRQNVRDVSGQLGRNLLIHPTTMISGLFDAPLNAYNAVPQAVGVDELRRDGLLIYGAAAPPDAGATAVALNGRALSEVMDSYDRLGTMTIIAIDTTSAGRVRVVRGKDLVTYHLTARDVQRLQRGMAHAADVLFAAGAQTVYPLSLRHPKVSRPELEAFRRGPMRPADLVLTSVHPLGTCRMGRDAGYGVVGPDHQVFGEPGLYVVDASVLPGTPRVNPQLTVMAMSVRAAESLDNTLT